MGCIHMPGKKPGKPGHDMNKVARPVVAQRGILRPWQRGQWSREKGTLGAPDLSGFQHAWTQGLLAVHLRRLVYAVTI